MEREGNLVIVEVLANTGFRTAIENEYGRDEEIYEGDRLVGVLANRQSGTSESGYIPPEGINIEEQTNLDLLAAGATPWLDFPGVGLPTTYTSPERFTRGIYTLFNYIYSKTLVFDS